MKWKWTFPVGLLILTGIFAVNHLLYYYRNKAVKIGASNGSAVMVRNETGPLGHNTISIDESSIKSVGTQFVGFATLKLWDYQSNGKVSPPLPVSVLNKRPVSLVGFMYPLESGERIRVFCLLRSTQTCCYGPRPQYNQYVLVETKEPVKFERLTPVTVEGTFFVDPRPDEGYIYRMTATAVQPVADDSVDVDANDLAKKLNLPKFNFDVLESLKSSASKSGVPKIPDNLSALDGKTVIIEGHIVGRLVIDPPAIIVGKYGWDGSSLGTRPGFFDAAVVFLRNQHELPPGWKQKGVFSGILKINCDPNKYSSKGIISICDARQGAGKRATLLSNLDMIPLLSVTDEIAILILFLSIAVWRRIHTRKRISF